MIEPKEQAEQITNNALATINAELEALDAWAIINAEDSEFAAEFLRDIKARHKALEDKRKGIVDPLNKALRAVNDLFRPPREALERAESLVKGKIARYLEDAAQANVEALAAASRADSPDEAASALSAVEDVATPAGVSVRYRWRAVIVAPEAVPVEFCSPDPVKIQDYTEAAVTLRGEPTPIPGVRFEKIPIVTSRAKP